MQSRRVLSCLLFERLMCGIVLCLAAWSPLCVERAKFCLPAGDIVNDFFLDEGLCRPPDHRDPQQPLKATHFTVIHSFACQTLLLTSSLTRLLLVCVGGFLLLIAVELWMYDVIQTIEIKTFRCGIWSLHSVNFGVQLLTLVHSVLLSPLFPNFYGHLVSIHAHGEKQHAWDINSP